MSIEIIVAIITSVASLLGTIFAVMLANSKTLYRIEQLEKKQDKHNQLIERMYAAEKSIAVLEEKVSDLEEKEAVGNVKIV